MPHATLMPCLSACGRMHPSTARLTRVPVMQCSALPWCWRVPWRPRSASDGMSGASVSCLRQATPTPASSSLSTQSAQPLSGSGRSTSPPPRTPCSTTPASVRPRTAQLTPAAWDLNRLILLYLDHTRSLTSFIYVHIFLPYTYVVQLKHVLGRYWFSFGPIYLPVGNFTHQFIDIGGGDGYLTATPTVVQGGA